LIKLKNLTEPQVARLAAELGRALRHQNAVIGLKGELGAGKTTFAKSLGKALGVHKIASPTFIIVAAKKFGKRKFYHIDFYRLSRLDELQHLGLGDIFAETQRVAVIEWVDKFPEVEKSCDMVIEFVIKPGNKRNVKIIS